MASINLTDINLGTVADDDTGEDLRSGGQKINTNNAALETNINAFNKRDVATSGTAIAWEFDTDNALTTAGDKLLSLKNNGVEQAYFDKDGSFFAGSRVYPESGNTVS